MGKYLQQQLSNLWLRQLWDSQNFDMTKGRKSLKLGFHLITQAKNRGLKFFYLNLESLEIFRRSALGSSPRRLEKPWFTCPRPGCLTVHTQSVPWLPHVADVLGLMKELHGFTLIVSMDTPNCLATVWTTFVLMPCIEKKSGEGLNG